MTNDASPRQATGSLLLLAPSTTNVPSSFRHVDVQPDRHAHLLNGVQRLRGSVYLDDGAIHASQLSPDGRHIQDADNHSWHVVSVDEDGGVSACARYRPHPAEVMPEDLGVWQSAIAHDPHWQSTLRGAIANEIDRARRLRVSYVEVGGWAVSRVRRGTTHAFETAVSAYALATGLGGCIGITTATVRHCSSRMLRKLGGRSLTFDGVEVPTYFDARYGCEMEILGFESNSLNRRYGAHIDRMFQNFANIPVIAAAADVQAPVVVDTRRPVVMSMAALAERHFPRFVPHETLVSGAA